jgi:hypothetical protein
MRNALKLPGLLACGVILWASPALAQGAAGSGATANPNTGAAEMARQAHADVAAASANTGVPVVNPPDPQNAGTLAESMRTTALATYPWSTADIWFGRR